MSETNTPTSTLPCVPLTPDWLAKYPRAVDALRFAALKHLGQVRKYTGEPYVYHCLDVMQRLYILYGMFGLEPPEDMLCAAALHDTVEDTETTYSELEAAFGPDITGMVFWLTDVSDHSWGNRALRKRIEAERINWAPDEARIIKTCDIGSNTTSIVAHDAKFAKTYLPEKQRVLDCIGLMTKARLMETIAYPYTAVR